MFRIITTPNFIHAARDMINLLDAAMITETVEDTLDSMVLILSTESPEFNHSLNVLQAGGENLRTEDIRHKVLKTCTVVQVLLSKWSGCKRDLEACHTQCERFLRLPSPDSHALESAIEPILHMLMLILVLGYLEGFKNGDTTPPLLDQLGDLGIQQLSRNEAFLFLTEEVEKLVAQGLHSEDKEDSYSLIVLYRCLAEHSRFSTLLSRGGISDSGDNERYQGRRSVHEESISPNPENQVQDLTDRLERLQDELYQARQDHEYKAGALEDELQNSYERVQKSEQEVDNLTTKVRQINHQRRDAIAARDSQISFLEAQLDEEKTLLAAKTALIKDNELLLHEKDALQKKLKDENEGLEYKLRQLQDARDVLKQKVVLIEKNCSQQISSIAAEIDLVRSELEQANDTIEVYERELADRDQSIRELREKALTRQPLLPQGDIPDPLAPKDLLSELQNVDFDFTRLPEDLELGERGTHCSSRVLSPALATETQFYHPPKSAMNTPNLQSRFHAIQEGYVHKRHEHSGFQSPSCSALGEATDHSIPNTASPRNFSRRLYLSGFQIPECEALDTSTKPIRRTNACVIC
ncbi:hypothetical protein PM082_000595 [Marasmius tenuissimus]|nr:hypothetical protein PM082_000595 [Marasmius tenuissimus]